MWIALAFGNLANAITYGVPGKGAHPNVVSISGFRQATDANGDPILISSGRCSGSLIRKEEDMLVFLTAGHCPQFWLEGLQNGTLVDVGVSFDEVIDKDLGVTVPLIPLIPFSVFQNPNHMCFKVVFVWVPSLKVA